MEASESNYSVLGRKFPKSEFVFFCQVLLIYIVVGFSVYNLTWNKQDDNKLWVALMSSSLGYLLPSPTLKKSKPLA